LPETATAISNTSRDGTFWGDETGLRSDDVRGRGYAPPGRTPEVRVNHRRANLGLISAVTNEVAGLVGTPLRYR
jgi:hypothetical protein